MRNGERLVWVMVVVALVAIAIAQRHTLPTPTSASVRPRGAPGVHVSMAALHQEGGVPLGWQLTLAPGDPAAGRRSFVDLGCGSCHRVGDDAGSAASAPQPGPELTGMGSHHPPAYFAEAILNPDAVVIDEPGYVGADGRSTMPSYPDLTSGELSDLVAYLASLRDGGATLSCHGGAASTAAALGITPVDLANRPSVPTDAHAFFTQSYDVLPGRLAELEAWFASDGRRQFFASEGLVSIESFVDVSRPSAAVTTVFGFRDEAALRNFLGDPAIADAFARFDALVGSHGHHASTSPLVYRAPSLSASRDDAR